jgi:hypothetical protein
MVGLKNGPPATPSEVGIEALWIRDNLLTPLGQRTFVVLDNKPLLLVLYCGQKQAPNATVTAAVSGDGTFTVRWLGTQLQENPDKGLREGFWSWMDGALAPIPTLRSDGTAEALTVTPAFFAGGGWLGPGARAQNRGSTYVAEMKVAVGYKPTVLLVCQWNEWAGQADHVGSYEDAYNISLTNDMEPTALAECGGYQHKDDAGQLPVCDTGWGFFNLNLLAATLQVYRESILSTNVDPVFTILRLLEPTKPRKWLATAEPDVLSETILRIEWTCIGRGCASGFRVELDDGSKLSKVVPNDNSSTAPPSQSVKLDLSSIGDGVHSVTVTSLSGKPTFPLSREQRDVDTLRHGSGVGSAARDSVSFRLKKPPIADRQVVSSAVGFVNQSNQTSYEYGPTIIQENGTYYNFFCSPGGFAPANNSGVVAWDVLRMTTSKDGLNWSAPEIALEPSTNYDHSSVCDPSIIKFKGSYFLYHTCINTCVDEKNGPPDKYHQNRICVAIADNVRGPFRKVVSPVIQDLSCAPKANATSCGKEVGAYCVGQPSAAVIDGSIVVFYSSIGGANDVMKAPNPGRILAMTSDNGVVFAARSGPPVLAGPAPLPPPESATLFTQRDIDVRYERESQQLVLVQGDVGSPEITWSLSDDGGLTWLAWSRNHTIVVHNASGPGQANHNPGLAGLPDGSFGGRSFSLYGSSFEDPGQWGRWHLFRSDIGIGPTATGCAACAPNGCDHACSVGGKTQRGLCKFPVSTDPGQCCECEEYVDPKPCAKCAASVGGCVELCIKAGHLAGMCAFGDDSPDGLCCTCFDLPTPGSNQTAARLKNDDESIDNGGSITMAWKPGHSGASASADIDTMKKDYSVSSVIIYCGFAILRNGSVGFDPAGPSKHGSTGWGSPKLCPGAIAAAAAANMSVQVIIESRSSQISLALHRGGAAIGAEVAALLRRVDPTGVISGINIDFEAAVSPLPSAAAVNAFTSAFSAVIKSSRLVLTVCVSSRIIGALPHRPLALGGVSKLYEMSTYHALNKAAFLATLEGDMASFNAPTSGFVVGLHITANEPRASAWDNTTQGVTDKFEVLKQHGLRQLFLCVWPPCAPGHECMPPGLLDAWGRQLKAFAAGR